VAALSTMLGEGKEGAPEFAELKRRLGWEWNGMRLHELYFFNLGGDGNSSAASKALGLINSTFGSLENWQKDFVATGKMRGIGWVVLYYDRASENAWNAWINEHDVAHPAGCVPLLVMDVFEHAYMTDYGIKRLDYIDAFMKAIDWSAVEKRMP
jgi:Fe-Mn family superoxide dismutase